MRKIKCCYLCPDRTVAYIDGHLVTCHAFCKTYHDEVAEEEKKNESIRQQKDRERDFATVRQNGLKKK